MQSLKRLWCKMFGHTYVNSVCQCCGHRLLSHAEIMQQLLFGVKALFAMEYKEYKKSEEAAKAKSEPVQLELAKGLTDEQVKQ